MRAFQSDSPVKAHTLRAVVWPRPASFSAIGLGSPSMRFCFTRREDVLCSLCSPVQYDPYRIVIPVSASWILYTGASTSIDLPKVVQAQILGFVWVISYHSVQYLRLRIEHAGVKRHLRYQFGSSLGKLQALLKVPQMFLWDLRRVFEMPQRFQVPYRTVLTLSIWNCA